MYNTTVVFKALIRTRYLFSYYTINYRLMNGAYEDQRLEYQLIFLPCTNFSHSNAGMSLSYDFIILTAVGQLLIDRY